VAIIDIVLTLRHRSNRERDYGLDHASADPVRISKVLCDNVA
jgi:hypothetical protein